MMITCNTCFDSKDEHHYQLRSSGNRRPMCEACRSMEKPFKLCNKCTKIKHVDEFQLRPSGNRRPMCEACRSADGAAKRYGLTVGEVEEQRKKQDNCCAICHTHVDDIPHASFKHNPLVIDHCHETNEFRGLLCPTCNTGLGQFKDNVQLLQRAIAYLTAPPIKG